jgi:hypothetical protein
MLERAKQALKRRIERAGYVVSKVAEADPMRGYAFIDKEVMTGLCDRISAMPPDQREAECRRLMAIVIEDPTRAASIDTALFRSEFGRHLLFHLLVGAVRFARGNIGGATAKFEEISSRDPDRLALMCLGRTRATTGNETAARAAFALGLQKFIDDPFFAFETAASYFREGDSANANRAIGHHQSTDSSPNALVLEIADAVARRTLLRSGDDDVYDDAFVRSIWHGYFDEFARFSRFQHPAAWLGHAIEAELGEIISCSQIDHVIDFGVFCAHPIHALAVRFPDVRFDGVDRQELIRDLNQVAFAAPNISYHAADIIEFLGRMNVGRNTMLFHSRTACLCYPEFLRTFYSECARRGVRHIWMYEGYALAHDRRYYSFDELPAVSVAARSIMFIHDYPRLLAEAGYAVRSVKRPFQTILLNHESDLGAVNFFLQAERDPASAGIHR